MKTYLISDTHFNHEKIKTYCDRPENFTDLLVDNIRRTVKADDLLIHIGDVFIGPKSGWDHIRDLLPGRKVLVRGNHDRNRSNAWWMEHGFDFSCDSFTFRHIYFTHSPAETLADRAVYNIHGHLHNIWHGFHKNAEDGSPEAETWITQRLKNDWQRLFSVEYTNYMPVELEKFLSHPEKYQATGPKKS